MHLINTTTARLKEISPRKKPKYAVLSHRWTTKEVTFIDISSNKLKPTSTIDKFGNTLRQARRDGLKYAWIDTCCINKQSSTELSEAINSMYRWYQDAELCYVYLQDVDQDDWQDSLHTSKWFKRGWTLQELLAPRTVVFYDKQWRCLGDKKSLADRISNITGIPAEVLQTGDTKHCSVAQRMAWAAKRCTTRPEDRAYCLMGLFNVNMPLLYGEGEKAFVRLQEEIIRYSDDHSIFAWSMGKRRFSGLLAPTPDCFTKSQGMVPDLTSGLREPFSMTNRGLSIKLKITPWSADTYLAYLDCAEEKGQAKEKQKTRVGIFLRRLHEDDQYMRISDLRKGLCFDTGRTQLWQDPPVQDRQLFVRQSTDRYCDKDCLKDRVYGFKILDGCLTSSIYTSAVRISADSRTATLRPGGSGCIAVIDVPAYHQGLRRIALGFDFEFNPVCLLEDSFSIYDGPSVELEDWYNWSRVLADDIEWNEIVEGGRVIRQMEHDGLWALKGDRLHGLDVLLSESFTDRGSLVSIKRDMGQSRLMWEFDIDSLVGPFRNHHPRALLGPYGSREHFQRICGLGDDMEEGDELLRVMYHTVGPAQAPSNLQQGKSLLSQTIPR